ncbi:MAG: TetR/AcrR family transcriptional regulator [Bryobacteraceae bacterium]
MLTRARRLPAGERRAAIVEAAILLFSEHGFHGSTTRDLARAVGVTEPILYRHFPTKRALYDAIIEAKSEEGRALQEAALGPYLHGRDDAGFFTRLAGLVFEKFDKDPAFPRLLFFSALERHDLADLFYKRQMLQFNRLIAGYIERRIRERGFRRVHPWAAARGFLGMIAHHAMFLSLFPRRRPPVGRARYVATVVDVFLHGLRTKG